MPGTLLIATLNLMWLARLKAMLAGWKVRISQEDISIPSSSSSHSLALQKKRKTWSSKDSVQVHLQLSRGEDIRAAISLLIYHHCRRLSLTGTGKIRPVLDRLAVGLLLIQKRTCPLGRRVLLPSESHLPTPTTLLAFAAALDHQPHCLQPAASSTVACISQEVVELPLPIRLSSILSYLSRRIFWCLTNRHHRRQGFPAKR
jgi:hypothetical protein